MARYAIPSERAFGVPMGKIQALAKQLGRDQALADALWETGWYEARMLCAYIGEPARLTVARMDAWCREFDNWAICDTLCFALFDRTPHAWGRVAAWAKRRDEFQRRAAFALLASLALHEKGAGDERYAKSLALIESAATDERNFVKKGVSWALRGVGRRSPALNRDAIALAKRLAASENPAARWIGKDALRELSSAAVQKRLAAGAAR
jgi:3-methyladenine DNA glycosylase AlkD